MNGEFQLKSIRQSKSLTQRQLADLVGVQHNTISDWENMRTSPDTDEIRKLCNALMVSADELLGTQKEPAAIDGGGLSEKEAELMRLLRMVPKEDEDLVLGMIESALKSRGLLES